MFGKTDFMVENDKMPHFLSDFQGLLKFPDNIRYSAQIFPPLSYRGAFFEKFRDFSPKTGLFQKNTGRGAEEHPPPPVFSGCDFFRPQCGT